MSGINGLRRIEDLDEAELVALTDEDVERFVEIEAASEGIVPVPAPGPAPVAPKIDASVVAYKVGDLTFMDQEEAGQVASMSSTRKTAYDYTGAGYNYEWLEPTDNVGVRTVRFYSEVDVRMMKRDLRLYEERKEAHAAEVKEYEKYTKSLEDVRAAVLAPVQEARMAAERLRRAREVYAGHLALAEGSRAIAANFFRKAYEGSPELIVAVLREPEGDPEGGDEAAS